MRDFNVPPADFYVIRSVRLQAAPMSCVASAFRRKTRAVVLNPADSDAAQAEMPVTLACPLCLARVPSAEKLGVGS
jgi:hypothetical protein